MLSPNPPKRREVVEKDEGISDEEDTAELKLQLELNEQVNFMSLGNFENSRKIYRPECLTPLPSFPRIPPSHTF